MTSRLLTPEDVHSVGVAAVRNAIDIMADAEILLGVNRPLRAYALGVIAVEEAAKLVCRNVLSGWTGNLRVAGLNRLLRSRGNPHLACYTDLLTHLWVLAPRPHSPSFDELLAMARVDMQVREQVLYVEVAPDGAPTTPQGVDEDEARKWVMAMIGLFLQLGKAWRHEVDDALADAEAIVTQGDTRPDGSERGHSL